MKTKLYLLVLLTFCILGACSNSDDPKDQTKPVISTDGASASPHNCQTFLIGDTIVVSLDFSDNVELGAYNIEIHNNFDHHTHSTSSVECDMEQEKTAVKPWVYNQDFDIPDGQKYYTANIKIPIPNNIDNGDYHFMVRLTDKEGWQELCAMSIKIK